MIIEIHDHAVGISYLEASQGSDTNTILLLCINMKILHLQGYIELMYICPCLQT